MHPQRKSLLALGAVVAAACSAPAGESTSASSAAQTKAPAVASPPLTSPIPAADLAAIKAALPKVGWPRLQAIFGDAHTYWYDHAAMQPSYQETGSPGGGAKDNLHWHDLIADTGSSDPNSNPEVGAAKVYDETNKHWRFPVAGTVGLDASTNATTVDFVSLPVDAAGKTVPIPISTVTDSIHKTWTWQFPNGTIVGEVIFVRSGPSLLPTEVRVRQRFPAGWATNSYRPFPEASALSTAIKSARPSWASTPALASLVAQLDGTSGLTPLRLTATGLTGTFDQAGFLDPLPDFADDALVAQLLTTTPFVAAYDAVWRQGADSSQLAFAASTASANLSVVPNAFQAGIIQVNEASCTRCHQETGKQLANWYPGLTLYGDVWGTDNVFTFHVFDESYYPSLDLDTGNGVQDNRHMNPALVSMGMIKTFDATTDTGPPYYNRQ